MIESFQTDVATGRPRAWGRPVLLCLVLWVSAACDGREAPVLVVDGDTIRLPAGTQIHDVHLREPDDANDPGTVRAASGDVVRFLGASKEGHAIVFVEAALAPAGRDFLDATGQLRGPPLLGAGTSWAVSFDGAPEGRYPFRCLGHGATGVVVVGAR